MIKTYTQKQLSDTLGINLAKQKRHSREFIGLDPEAGQSSGVERRLTLEQAFIVYLCGVAVNFHKVPLKEAAGLAKDLPVWLEKAKYFPVLDHLKNRRNMDPDIHSGGDTRFVNDMPDENEYLIWHLLISKSKESDMGLDGGYTTTAKGFLYMKAESLDEDYDDPIKWTEVYISEFVSMHGRSSVNISHTIFTSTIYLDSEFMNFSDKLGI